MKAILDKIFEIESLLQFNSDNLQCFKDFNDYELNKTYTIEDEIQITKIVDKEHFVRFIAVLLPQKSFNLHCHNCIEKIKVLGGQLEDSKRRVIADVNEEILYSKSEVHMPRNPSESENCTLQIDFYK